MTAPRPLSARQGGPELFVLRTTQQLRDQILWVKHNHPNLKTSGCVQTPLARNWHSIKRGGGEGDGLNQRSGQTPPRSSLQIKLHSNVDLGVSCWDVTTGKLSSYDGQHMACGCSCHGLGRSRWAGVRVGKDMQVMIITIASSQRNCKPTLAHPCIRSGPLEGNGPALGQRGPNTLSYCRTPQGP